MNALGLSILTLLTVVVLSASRRLALLGMVAGVLFLTQGKAVDVLGINLYAMRFLEVAGFARIIMRKEFDFSKLNNIDRLFLWFYGYTTIVFLLRSSEGQAYQIGTALDAVFCYFIFRGLIQNLEDLKNFLSDFIILLVPYFLIVLVQRFTASNPLSLVGGPQGFLFRNGRPRCIGSFRHPILFGSLGATFLPLFVAYLLTWVKYFRALAGIVFCLGIVLFANSGGPVSAAGVGIIGWLLWPLRKKMRTVRRTLVGMIAIAALLMKAPIWYLPARVSDIFGGHGWHRSYLIDVAFQNVGKWWLAGMPIADTKDWFPYSVPVIGGADITNQYLLFGLYAGIGSMILFIALLIQSFRSLGKRLQAFDNLGSRDAFLLWGLGVMLSVHIVNWLNVSYFDQFSVIWFLQLAVISSVTTDPTPELCRGR